MVVARAEAAEAVVRPVATRGVGVAVVKEWLVADEVEVGLAVPRAGTVMAGAAPGVVMMVAAAGAGTSEEAMGAAMAVVAKGEATGEAMGEEASEEVKEVVAMALG